MNIIDIGIICILLFGAIRGYRRGLLLTLVSLGSYVVGLLVATRYYGVVAEFFNAKLGLSDRVAHYLGASPAIPAVADQASVTVLPPSQVETLLSNIPVPAFAREELVRSLNDIINLSFQQGITRLGEAIMYFFANMAVDALAFLLLCLIVGKLVRVIAGWLTDLSGRSLLGGLNRTTGLIIGTGATTLILTVFTGLLTPFFAFAGSTTGPSPAAEALSQSMLIPHLMNGWHFLVKQLPLLLN